MRSNVTLRRRSIPRAFFLAVLGLAPSIALVAPHLDPGERFLYLGDPQGVAIGVDLRAGGTIGSLIYRGRELVDRADFGRYVQVSLYDGGDTYGFVGQAGIYNGWGWNPIQAGNRFGGGARVVRTRLTSSQLSVRAFGSQWGSNAPADVIFDTTIRDLDGAFAVSVTSTNVGQASHRLALQEWPAAYFSGSLSEQVGYYGGAPFTGEATVTTAYQGSACPYVVPTEHWVGFAAPDKVGVVLAAPPQPGLSSSWSVCRFDWVLPAVSYAAPIGSFAMPAGASRTLNYYLIPGPIEQARARVYDLLGPDLVPGTDALTRAALLRLKGSGGRTGLPAVEVPLTSPGPADGKPVTRIPDTGGWTALRDIGGMSVASGILTINVSGPDPAIVSPVLSIDASATPAIEIRMRVEQSGSARLFFVSDHQRTYGTSASVAFPVHSGWQTYRLTPTAAEGWLGTITALRFDPGATAGVVQIQSIHAVGADAAPGGTDNG